MILIDENAHTCSNTTQIKDASVGWCAPLVDIESMAAESPTGEKTNFRSMNEGVFGNSISNNSI